MNTSIQRPAQQPTVQDWHRSSGDLAPRAGAGSQTRANHSQGPVRAEVNFSSLLAQSAEELTQAVASRVQSRTLKERKLTDSGVKPPDRELLKALIEAFAASGEESGRGRAGSRQSHTETSRAAGEHLQTLIKKAKEKPASLLQEVADEVGADPTEQYLALLDMAYRFQDDNAGGDPGGNGEAAVWAAIEELAAEKGEQIRADLNTFEATRALPPGEAAALRVAYKDVVLASESLADAGRHVLSASQGQTGEAFLRTLKTLIAALGHDLASIRSSTEPAKLKSLLTDLHHLETLATVVDRCNELGETLSKRHGAPRLQATALASDLVALSGERWMDSMRVLRLSEQHGANHSLSTAVDLVTGMRNTLRDLPVWSFASSEARDSILEAAQDAMDAAIDREEGYA